MPSPPTRARRTRRHLPCSATAPCAISASSKPSRRFSLAAGDITVDGKQRRVRTGPRPGDRCHWQQRWAHREGGTSDPDVWRGPISPVPAYIHNVTFDAEQPRCLGRFWSQVTGYIVVDERDDFVRLRAPDDRGISHILFIGVDDPTPG